jgi:hypothetical protein
MGYPHTSHPHHPLYHRRWQLPFSSHDTEQSEEGAQGEAEKGQLKDTLHFRLSHEQRLHYASGNTRKLFRVDRDSLSPHWKSHHMLLRIQKG